MDTKFDPGFTLINSQSMIVRLSSYGARVMSIKVPDHRSELRDVVLGYNESKSLRDPSVNPYFGCTVGRYAGRINNGHFQIDNEDYSLPTNNGNHHLHGGQVGFDRYTWEGEPFKNGVRFKRISPAGEEGYPGNLHVEVSFTLSEDNQLSMEYFAKTDVPTPLNLTNHTYFNLSGEGSPSINDHQIMIKADAITEINNQLIPTGKFLDVTGTPFDFRKEKRIGDNIDSDHPQLIFGNGYDHNFVLDSQKEVAAVLYDPDSRRQLTIRTDQPGIQFYTANFLDGTIIGKTKKPYPFRSGLCLETQHFPDSPNHSHFPSTILRPGQEFRSYTHWHFSAR